MMKKNKITNWGGLKIILFVPLITLLLQAFAKPETLIENVFEVVPVIQQDETSEWMDKWTKENIGTGFFQPEFKIPASEKENNILVILLNRRNQYLVENKYATKEQIKGIVMDFLNGRDTDGKVVVDYEVKNIPSFGEIKVPKGYISFRNDLATSDEAINFTFREIGEAYLEARNEKAKTLFGEDYFNLDKDKKDAVDNIVPIRFSIAQPKTVKSTLKPPPPPPPINIKIDKKGEFFLGTYSKTENQKMSVDWSKSKKVSLDELQEYLIKQNSYFPISDENTKTKYHLMVNLVTEAGVSEQNVEQIKELLKKAKIDNVNFSTIKE